MSPQIMVLVIALTIGFSVLLHLAVFVLYMYSLPAELDVHAPLVDDVDVAEEFPFPGVVAGMRVSGWQSPPPWEQRSGR